MRAVLRNVAAADPGGKAAAASNAAAAEKAAAAVPADVEALLARLSLSAFAPALCAKLGVTAAADIALLDDSDLAELGMLKVQRCKLMQAVAGGQPAPPPPVAASPAGVALLRPTGANVALCVGVAAYTGSGWGRLANAVHDAEDVGAALAGKGYDVTVLRDASLRQMKAALSAFSAKLQPGGVAFFFFSGHGLQGPDNKNYLIPAEGVESDALLEDDALSMERVHNCMAGRGCMLHVVVADACREKAPPVASTTKSGLQRGFAIIPLSRTAQAGSVLSYSCDPGKVSYDAPCAGGRNGAFTTALLKHLTAEAAHVDAIFIRTTSDVVASTGDKQHHASSA
jgi:hypothetical protein